jgi:hypothetical protein
MRSTLYKFFLVPALAAAATMFTHTAQAETVNVPFSFTAMGQTFPAGAYSVEEDVNTNFVTLRLKSSNKSIISVLGPGDTGHGDNRVVLRFSMAGDDHVLNSIQFGVKSTARLPELDRRSHEASTGPVSGR